MHFTKICQTQETRSLLKALKKIILMPKGGQFNEQLQAKFPLQPAIFSIKPDAIYHLPTCCCEVSQGVVVVDNSLLLAVTLAQAAVEAVDKALGGHRAPDVVLTMH